MKWILSVVTSSFLSLATAGYAQSDASTSSASGTIPAGITKNTILIGQTGALTGPLSLSNLELNAGAKLVFDEVNGRGGVHGRKILMRTLDDQFDPRIAVENVKKLIEEEQVLMLFGCGGAPANLAIAASINASRIPHLAPATGADALHDAQHPYVFHTRASYGAELDKIVEHLVTMGSNKIAVVYADNAFGKGGLSGVEVAAKKYNIKINATVLLKDGPGQADAAVKDMLAKEPNAIISITSANGIEFTKIYRQYNKSTPFFTISLLGSPPVIKALGADASGLGVSQIVPNPYSAASPLVAQYQAAMRKSGNSAYSYASFEGYINARILVEALRRAGRDLSRPKVVAALRSMNPYNLNGYEIGFGKDNRTGSKFVEISMVGRSGRFIR